MRLFKPFMLIYGSTENYNNATYSVCNTAFIFESFGDASPKTDIVCGDKSQIWSFYRSVPASVRSQSRKYQFRYIHYILAYLHHVYYPGKGRWLRPRNIKLYASSRSPANNVFSLFE